MIGFYNYTVILTYLSALSGTAGVILCLSGVVPAYVGMFFLMFSGVCDSFDGMVARTMKDRSRRQRSFGVQIDSLADLVSFGVLPACLGVVGWREGFGPLPNLWLSLPLALLFMLGALIRLAYFNVLEEERAYGGKSDEKRVYVGLPTTSVALIFPGVAIIQCLSKANLSWLYLAAMLVVAYLFVSKVEIPKPGIKGILALIGVGAVEFAVLMGLTLGRI